YELMVHYRTHKLPIVNQMKLLLITLSILLTSSPLFGQETGVLYLWENGTKYMGEWKDGKKHGQGTKTWSDGEYVGKWKNGEYHGQGTLTLLNGDKYEGKFKDGEKWNGTQYDKDGNITKKYVNGEIQK
ncbi:MAG: MORN motif precursor, partial [SAR324 cluster bacterium]|nr:MORN motif precursor [SAR324 cluster bacterium]